MVYPSIGLSVIFPFIFLFNGLSGNGLSNSASSKQYFIIYLCAIMLPTVILVMRYSENYKGAWIYKAAPIKETADIYRGAFKAFVVKLVLPVFIFEGSIFTAIFGIRIIPDLILIFLNMMLFIVICFKAFPKALPFSEAFGTTQQGAGIVIIPIMLLMGVMALVYYISTMFSYGVLIYIIIALLLNAAAWRKALTISLDS